ncbi:MAG: hypothetical protein IMW89_16740, partial [Ktedonobacteraceae bacterium]|nr:hypothetical protein [Ktedonobacteraceae bacterium]
MAPDHKQMGAYYTKADIAEYICKNTIIPCIFDIVQQAHPTAFTPAGPVWSHLIHAPDCYISPAIREQHHLPGESEREYQFRRSLYNDIHRKLAAGTITSLHDFLTYNLDSHRFAQDVLSRCTHSSLLRAFYQTISRLTILDPTCGPGAFLLAALSLLEPLYAACLTRMEQMLTFNVCPVSAQASIQPADLTLFKDVLNHAGKYTDRNYFIVKFIIANNLYGVDLMPEAVERCQQQLLRRLVAHQHSIAGIESLPAGEHNIRSGNALVGFTRTPVTAPAALYKQQTHFVAALNHVLAREYGIDRQHSGDEADYELAFQRWLADHKPFHWCSEFPRIMERG